jgi:hypothetical protein
MSNHVKILFEYDTEQEGCGLESMWAVPVEGGYEIDSIPFFVKGIAAHDIVEAATDEAGMLRFKSLLRPSGHSTIRLWFSEDAEKDVQSTRDELRGLGCASELSDLPRLVAVDVPASADYATIRIYLDAKEAAGVFEYQEACLGFKS